MKNKKISKGIVNSEKQIFWTHEARLISGTLKEFNSFMSKIGVDLQLLHATKFSDIELSETVSETPKRARKSKGNMHWNSIFGKSLNDVIAEKIKQGESREKALEMLYDVAIANPKCDIVSAKRLRHLLSVSVQIHYAKLRNGEI